MSIVQQPAVTVNQRSQAPAWASRAEELAHWTLCRLLNRDDVHGAYNPLHRRGQPRRDGRLGRDGKPELVGKLYTSKERLTREKLIRHYGATRPEHVVGLHSTSTANTCRSGAFDVDCHGETTDPEDTSRVAFDLHDEVVRRGFRPLLTDSNGEGGYHVRLILSSPVPSRDLQHLLRRMAQAVGYVGELFPKQPELRSPFGNWLRLPGRHHTRDHWSRAFDGSRWVAGADAVAWLLSFAGDDPALVPVAEVPPPEPRPRFAFSLPPRPDSLDRRTAAYLARCPCLAEGEGRDDVAYRAAAFLVRDLGLSDDVALTWLEAWDRGNRPPKGRDRLEQIIVDAHHYGQRSYGSGLDRGPS